MRTTLNRFRSMTRIIAITVALRAFGPLYSYAQPPDVIEMEQKEKFKNLDEVLRYLDPKDISNLTKERLRDLTEDFATGGRFSTGDLGVYKELLVKINGCLRVSSDEEVNRELKRLRSYVSTQIHLKDKGELVKGSEKTTGFGKSKEPLEIRPYKTYQVIPTFEETSGSLAPGLKGTIQTKGSQEAKSFLIALAKTQSPDKLELNSQDIEALEGTLRNSITKNSDRWGPLGPEVLKLLDEGKYVEATNKAMEHPEIVNTNALKKSLDGTVILYPDKLIIFSSEIGVTLVRFNEETAKAIEDKKIDPKEVSTIGKLFVRLLPEYWNQAGEKWDAEGKKEITAHGVKVGLGLGGKLEFYEGSVKKATWDFELRGDYLYLSKAEIKRAGLGFDTTVMFDLNRTLSIGGRVAAFGMDITESEKHSVLLDTSLVLKAEFQGVSWARMAVLGTTGTNIVIDADKSTTVYPYIGATGTIEFTGAEWLNLLFGTRWSFSTGGEHELILSPGVGFKIGEFQLKTGTDIKILGIQDSRVRLAPGFNVFLEATY